MKLFPPAKVNWTLEVLGRRDDGYHEVRSLMQAIDLRDDLDIEPAEELRLEVEGQHTSSEDDLVLRAARAHDAGSEHGALIQLCKRIPVGAGLGGGSSDAAAALRGLNEMWGLGRSDEELAALAASLGSDVPFFLSGGTALAEGRGERVTPLPDVAPLWLVLLVPPLRLEEKTKRMYAALERQDFSDGARTAALAERLRRGEPVRDDDVWNAFERAAYEVFAGLETYREALLASGAERVHLAGSGPALFALCGDEAEANALRDKVGPPHGGQLLIARTLTAAESLRREE